MYRRGKKDFTDAKRFLISFLFILEKSSYLKISFESKTVSPRLTNIISGISDFFGKYLVVQYSYRKALLKKRK